MMGKFKVGDVIVGKNSSNVYGCTSRENKWVGSVESISKNAIGDIVIEVITLDSIMKEDTGKTYYVNPKHFKSKKHELVEIDISVNKKENSFEVYKWDDIKGVRIRRGRNLICSFYIGENDLSFKEAKKMLKILGYKLIDGNKVKAVENKRDQAKYSLSKKTLKDRD